MHLEILFEDEYIIAINKPTGILVHKTKISEDRIFLLQVLRNQLGYQIFTIHRLDRATSGVILFAKDPQTSSLLNALFMNREVEKHYLALVRGWTEDEATIDYALADEETGKFEALPALTNYKTLGRSEIDSPIGLRYPTARFSLVDIRPVTGRRHQIRKHFSHLRHPIIGDKRHGDVKQNKYFDQRFGVSRMLLHAYYISFNHPVSGEKVSILAPLEESYLNALRITDVNGYLPLELRRDA